MQRCASCGRAVDDSSGLSAHASCPWCGGELAYDIAGPRTLADAVQVLWSVDPEAPYDGRRAQKDLADLCPGVKRAGSDLFIAGEVGALVLLRDGKAEAARRVLREDAHWDDAAVDALVSAYHSLDLSGAWAEKEEVLEDAAGDELKGVDEESPREVDKLVELVESVSEADAPLPRDGKRVAAIAAVIVIALVIVMVVVVGCFGSINSDATTAESSTTTEAATYTTDKTLSELSWSELKGIADEIAVANSNAEGLEIAKSYGLVGSDGKLKGGSKSVTLADGTVAHVRIAGFRHDKRADGGGKAGITFEFADAFVGHRMNPTDTNEGGWEGSEMREWLNSDFLTLLPEDLVSCIVKVQKRTNNTGKAPDENITSVVTTTKDKIWLLSVTEVYGKLSNSSYGEVYEAEGTQYQLYANQGVSTTDYSFCAKSGVYTSWRLRSPVVGLSSWFRHVLSDGELGGCDSSEDAGVSPGFCF